MSAELPPGVSAWAYPCESFDFIRGVNYGIFQSILWERKGPFAQHVREEFGDDCVKLAETLGRSAEVGSSDWPGFVYVKVGRMG